VRESAEAGQHRLCSSRQRNYCCAAVRCGHALRATKLPCHSKPTAMHSVSTCGTLTMRGREAALRKRAAQLDSVGAARLRLQRALQAVHTHLHQHCGEAVSSMLLLRRVGLPPRESVTWPPPLPPPLPLVPGLAVDWPMRSGARCDGRLLASDRGALPCSQGSSSAKARGSCAAAGLTGFLATRWRAGLLISRRPRLLEQASCCGARPWQRDGSGFCKTWHALLHVEFIRATEGYITCSRVHTGHTSTVGGLVSLVYRRMPSAQLQWCCWACRAGALAHSWFILQLLAAYCTYL